jgi:DNA mismatch endonuclease, patch repair protein
MKRRAKRAEKTTDVLTPEQRSWCMSRIKGKDTKPELCLRKALWALGLRYRLGAGVAGRPDMVFKSAKVAIFVDGCFWHRCPRHGVMPKHNRDFWRKKIEGNVERDRRVNDRLRGEGWKVLRFWEHDVESDLEIVLRTVVAAVLQK